MGRNDGRRARVPNWSNLPCFRNIKELQYVERSSDCLLVAAWEHECWCPYLSWASKAGYHRDNRQSCCFVFQCFLVYISACACGGQCMGPSCPLLVFVPELWHPMLHLSLFFSWSDLYSFVSVAVDMTKDRCFHHDWQRCHKGWVEGHGAQETAMGSELMCFHWCRVGWVPQPIKGNTSWFLNLKSDAFDTCIDWLTIEFGTNTCEFFRTNDKLSLVVFYLIQIADF